jgi:hypothetical protein
MKYLFLIYSNEGARAGRTKAEIDQMSGAYGAYAQAMQQAGVLVGGERLRPITDATCVRVENGKTEVLNGPYAETREQLAGYFMVELADLDAALSWAARCPGAAVGTIEVRPIWPM